MNKKVVIISSVIAGLVVIGGLLLYFNKKKTTTLLTDLHVQTQAELAAAIAANPNYLTDRANAAAFAVPPVYVDSRIPSPKDYYTDTKGATYYVGNYA